VAYLAVLNVGSAMLSDIMTGLVLPFSSSKPSEASLMDVPGDDEEAASACGLDSQDQMLHGACYELTAAADRYS
jgi:hypothetical protein